MNDPLDLFGKKTKSNKSTPMWIFIVVFLASIAMTQILSGRWDFWQEGRQKPAPVKSGGTLLFIHERQGLSIDQDLLLRNMPEYVSKQKLDGFRSLDEETPGIETVIEFAKSKNINPPCVVYVDGDQNLVSAIPWPDNINDLGKL